MQFFLVGHVDSVFGWPTFHVGDALQKRNHDNNDDEDDDSIKRHWIFHFASELIVNK